MSLISAFRNIKETKPFRDVDIFHVFDNIKVGKYQDTILKVRLIKDKKERQIEKRKLPLVTISGIFTERLDSALVAHSGYLAIDVDDPVVGAERLKDALKNDRYTFGCFVSASGVGLCIIIKIDPARHRDAYRGFAKYLYDTYREVVDTSCINESRARYVSWDPDLFLNPDSLTFKKYPPKPKAQKVPKFIHVETDFDDMVNKLAPFNICEDYATWHQVGNALHYAYKGNGRQYFHLLSAAASTYDSAVCDRQYDAIIKYEGSSTSKQATLGTIYYYAKLHGVPFYSDRTKEIISSTNILRKSGLKVPAIIDNLNKFKGIVDADAIVEQAYNLNIEIASEDGVISEMETWLMYNYEIRYNLIRNRVELNGKEMTNRAFNDLWRAARKVFDKDANTDTLKNLLESSLSVPFNPILDFFERYKERTPQGAIAELFEAIDTDTGFSENNFDPEYCLHFGTKWLVGMIALAHGIESPLQLTLCGETTGTGKTHFFRKLLPDELQEYYNNFKPDIKDKDSFIQMCEHWLLLDDEMGGKSTREAFEFKSMSSQDKASIRRSHARFAETMFRLAALGATSNEEQVINDHDNRRIIPVRVSGIDWAKYDAVDKIDVIMEAYHLYKAGFDFRILDEEKTRLNGSAEGFRTVNSENELINRLYMPPVEGHGNQIGLVFKTCTDIAFEVNGLLHIKTGTKKIGSEMKRMGYARTQHKGMKGYWVVPRPFLL